MKNGSNAKQGFVRVAKFVIFSCMAGIIQTVTFTILNEVAHLPYYGAYLPALILSVLYNFTVNRKFTFKSATNIPIAMLKVFAYYCVFTPVSTIGGNYLQSNLGWNEYLVLAINMILNLSTEFLFCRYVVYRNSIDTNKQALKEKADNEDGESEETADVK